MAFSMTDNLDGGYIFASYVTSISSGILVINTDSLGNQIWNKTINAPFNNARARAITRTIGGGYAIAGTKDYAISSYKPWIIKLAEQKRVILTTPGALPFYTNISSNPYTINLNENQSQIITFYVNATGNLQSTYEFFGYASINKDPEQLYDESIKFNVTIDDYVAPIVTLNAPNIDQHIESFIPTEVTFNCSASDN
jgi:hypothetical protein